MLAILGGLYLFGPSGIVLGPAILAVTVAILEVWHRRAIDTPVSPATATPLVAVTLPEECPANEQQSEPAMVEKSEVAV